MLRRLGAAAALALALLAGSASAQDPDPVGVGEATIAPAEVAPGGTATVSVALSMDPGWHVYGVAETKGIPASIKVKKGAWPTGLSGGKPGETKEPHDYESAGDVYLVHEGELGLTLPVEVAADAAPGARTISGYVEYQVCNDRTCLPPVKVPFEVTLTVVASGDRGGEDEEPAAGNADDGARIARMAVVPAEVEPGASAVIEIEFAIDAGWYLYAQEHEFNQPPTFSWKLPDGVTAGALIEVTKPKEKDSFGDLMRVFEKKLVLRQELTVGAGVAGGAYDITGKARWQHCNESMCVPTIEPVSVRLVVAGGSGEAAGGAVKPAGAAAAVVRVVSSRFRETELTRGQSAVLDVVVEAAPGWSVVTDGERAPKLVGAGRPSGFGNAVLSLDGVVEGTGRFELAFEYEVRETVSLGKQEFAQDLAWVASDGEQIVKGKTATKAEVAVVTQGVTGTRILQAIGLGLLTLLTPCVFPLLPVTVSFFSKQEGPAAPRSIVYGLGIVFTITIVGLIFKSSLDVFARGTAFNIIVALLFIVLSLSLFGLFDLRMPSFLIDASAKRSGGGGLMGAFFMAVTLSLTSFSCSLPFLAALFADFEQGDQVTATFLLVIYSMTMAAPFVFCSLFPAMLQAMPGAGGWMNAIKVTMGFVEFAMAFKFIRGAALAQGWEWMPRSFVLAIWVACSLAAALYLFGYLVLPHDTKTESIGVLRLLWALFFLASALYLMPGVWGYRLNSYIEGFILTQPNEIRADVASGSSGGGGDTAAASNGHGQGVTHWPRDDWDGALERAGARGSYALFDFTGVG